MRPSVVSSHQNRFHTPITFNPESHASVVFLKKHILPINQVTINYDPQPPNQRRPEVVEQVQGLVSALVTMPEYDPAKASGGVTEEFCRTGKSGWVGGLCINCCVC